MTTALPSTYVLAAACEVAGVVLVVAEVIRSQRLWATYNDAVRQEQQAMDTDLRFRLDPLTTRYGLTPTQIHRTITTVESLVAVDRRKQALAVSLLLAGIIVNLVANVISMFST